MEMLPRATRYELKMQTGQAALPAMRAWVRLNSAAFSEAYPPRQVNSVYFDTHALDTFSDHIEGIPRRRKLRFRWYGADLTSARGQLELKEKSDRVGWKQVYPLDAALRLDVRNWADIQADILSGLDDTLGAQFREMLLVSRPLVLNYYRREYYISADHAIRLTLDYDMRVYDQWLTPRPNLTFASPVLDQMLIEFKCDTAHARALADVLAEFPLRASRHSKFVTALGTLLDR